MHGAQVGVFGVPGREGEADMLFQETIARKRDGNALSRAEIAGFVQGFTRGELPDYQASALLMAIFLRGMSPAETTDLTAEMAASGGNLDLSALEGERPTVDKHSTGGVGDKASLVVVPILAAAGAAVCKMSGRGLGHTGGTLDKLESIPGFRVRLSAGEMIAQVGRIGACLAGQTVDLAPADKKLYALRDATATTESLPLIVSSILSKKLAGGARRFLFDVKVGNGALMKQPDEALALARALVEGSQAQGRAAVAVLTDMSQPMGRAIGNALEIQEAIALLTPETGARADTRFRELCLHLSGEGLLLAGLVESRELGRERAERLLSSGDALARFRALVVAQGGDPRCVDDPLRLPTAPIIQEVVAPHEGFVAEFNTAALGMTVVRLGGGRARQEDVIDPAVGIVVHVHRGEYVTSGQTLFTVHSRTKEAGLSAVRETLSSVRFSEVPVDETTLILGRLPV